MNHPLRNIMTELETSQSNFALVVGLTQTSISMTCKGYIRTPARVLEALEEIGYDMEEYLDAEQRFLDARKIKLMNELKQRRESVRREREEGDGVSKSTDKPAL